MSQETKGGCPSTRRRLARLLIATVGAVALTCAGSAPAWADSGSGSGSGSSAGSSTTSPSSGGGSSGAAANPNTFELTAEGDGEYFELDDAQLPATTTVAVSPYSAQASLDSTGNSTAFAGLPYLGPVAETLGGTINGLSGGSTPPIPPAPGYVATSYPTTPTATESQGPYLITASSQPDTSTASAGFGLSPSASGGNQQIFSKASAVANPDGSVQSSASAGADGFNLGIVDLLNVSSSVTMTEQAGSAPQITATTNLGTIQILDFKLGIDQNGFELLGDTIGIPTGAVLQAINSALSAANIEISILPAVTYDAPGTNVVQSYTTGGLQIKTVQNVPSQGPVTVTYTFARATVSAIDQANGASTGGSVSGTGSQTAPISSSNSTSSPTNSSQGLSSASAAVTATGNSGSSPDLTGTASSGGSPSLAPGSSSATAGSGGSGGSASIPSSSGSSVSTGGSTLGPTTLGSIHPISLTGTSADGIYLLIVLGALAALVGGAVFRFFGIRLTLGSLLSG
jgi:hypothetical protein